jgi:starch synthase
VVASRIGGIPDVVEDGVTGLLVPPGDAAALAGALRRLLDEPDLARKLGEAGRRRLHEHFSWEAITARWEAVYSSLR